MNNTEKIQAIESQMQELRKELSELRKTHSPTLISDYTFSDIHDQPISLSSLFNDQNELMLIHNMGKSCPYCTLWADEYNGIYEHLKSRVPFVVISPDTPEVMKEFSESRNWRFPIYSSINNSFKKDMGFETNGKPDPGVSVFIKNDSGEIYHKTWSSFGPGDNYCSFWDYLDLLPEGYSGWHPKYSYK